MGVRATAQTKILTTTGLGCAVYCTQKRKTNASNVNVYIVPLYHILDSDRSYYLYETS